MMDLAAIFLLQSSLTSSVAKVFALCFALQKLRSGTTGVSVLMRGDHCYFAWLGDSQVLLVREGRAVKLMEPHKPHREV